MSPDLSGARAAASATPETGPAADDPALLSRLLAGDERAFAEIVDGWSSAMLRVARAHVRSHASAEEVVQETWLAVLRGLAQFERRSSLRTWVFRILVNTAKTRGVRESRTVPWSTAFPDGEGGPTVEPVRFRGPDDQWPGHWTPEGAPQAWPPTPESSYLAGEVRGVVGRALDQLPARQGAVVAMRDVEGYSAEEVCTILELSAANQRVLLHRGRARVRAGLEKYFTSARGRSTP